jgi:hypothetical protein
MCSELWNTPNATFFGYGLKFLYFMPHSVCVHSFARADNTNLNFTDPQGAY